MPLFSVFDSSATYVLRDLEVFGVFGSTSDVLQVGFFLEPAGDLGALVQIDGTTGKPAQWQGRFVIPFGYALGYTLFVDGALPKVSIAATGYRLTLP